MDKTLKVLLIKKDVRNFDLAKHLNVDPSKVSKIVNGWIEPDDILKNQIAAYLGVPAESIWGSIED